MSKTQEADSQNKNYCEHCKRTFIRDSTLLKHMCESKRRWLDKDRPANRIAYGAWKQYYQQCHPSKKKLEYTEFMISAYYTAFVKFGSYCTETKVVNSIAYCQYLTKNKVPIDNWASDRSYTKFLIEYLKTENPLDAVKRSMETMLDISSDQNLELCDVFRFANANKLCNLIANGKISPWILYNSVTGKKFLSSLNRDQLSLVFEYIDPEKWNVKFKRDQESVQIVSEVISGIPGL